MAKEYRLYAMVFDYSDKNVKSVNSSYYTESMASAQALFEADLKARGKVPLAILSDAQVRRKVTSMLKSKH